MLRYLKVDLFFSLVVSMIQEDVCLMQEHGKDASFCLLLPSNSSMFMLNSLLVSSILLSMVGIKL